MRSFRYDELIQMVGNINNYVFRVIFLTLAEMVIILLVYPAHRIVWGDVGFAPGCMRRHPLMAPVDRAYG